MIYVACFSICGKIVRKKWTSASQVVLFLNSGFPDHIFGDKDAHRGRVKACNGDVLLSRDISLSSQTEFRGRKQKLMQ